eukprot:jgi/Hompol1/4457/HPOL_007113-RA
MEQDQTGKVVRSIVAGIKACKGETDPGLNPYLSSALHQAKMLQVPKANVEEAIKRAVSSSKGPGSEDVKRIVYEGLSPVKNVAVMIEVLTGNSNKSSSEIRLIFKKAPGSSLTPVGYLFDRRGRIVFGPGSTNHGIGEMTDAAIEAQVQDIGDDIIDDETGKVLLEVFCETQQLASTQRELEKGGYEIVTMQSGYFAKEPVVLQDRDEIAQLEQFLEALEAQDETVQVSHNAEWE